MKITIVHTNNKKQLLVSNKTMEKLLERIAKDDSKNTVTHFREYVTYMESGYEYYKDMPTWMHIYPAAEFAAYRRSGCRTSLPHRLPADSACISGDCQGFGAHRRSEACY